MTHLEQIQKILIESELVIVPELEPKEDNFGTHITITSKYTASFVTFKFDIDGNLLDIEGEC